MKKYDSLKEDEDYDDHTASIKVGPKLTPDESFVEGGLIPAFNESSEVKSPESGASNKSLVRALSFWDGLGVIVGIQIGSGIFASAGTALREAGSCGAALCAWVVSAGLVAIGSLCYGELGASIPSAGGDAEYLRQAYGELAAFSFVWTNFWVIKPGSQAIISLIFGEYLAAACGDQSGRAATPLAVACLLVLTLSNCLGIRAAANFQNALTLVKAAMIALLFAAGLAHLAAGHTETLRENFGGARGSDGEGGGESGGWSSAAGVLRALVPCLWAFDGWADAGALAEELVNPAKQLPAVIGKFTPILRRRTRGRGGGYATE